MKGVVGARRALSDNLHEVMAGVVCLRDPHGEVLDESLVRTDPPVLADCTHDEERRVWSMEEHPVDDVLERQRLDVHARHGW